MALYRETGVVLRTYKLGEADRIVVALTKGRGKVRAVAKGVRKTRSKFGSRLEPMSHVKLQFFETRGDLDIVTGVETIDVFRSTRDDFERLSRAVSLLEAADELTIEGEPNLKLFNMLVGALRTLNDVGHPVVVPAFLLKALSLEGLRPDFDSCIECQSTDDLVAFDPGSGGVLCEDDRRAMPMSAAALALARQVLNGRLAAALAEAPSPAVTELELLTSKLFEFQVERRLRALGLMSETSRR